MTSWALGKDIGRDSPFHVGLHTLETMQLINLNLKLSCHVVRQCQTLSVWRLERGQHVPQVSTISYLSFHFSPFLPALSVWGPTIISELQQSPGRAHAPY
jgi:hypothetical protein